MMTWDSATQWLTFIFSGHPGAILIAVLFTLFSPMILHYLLYRSAARPPTAARLLLLGPAGSGKTSLVTLLQKQSLPSALAATGASSLSPSATHTSQAPRSYALKLPGSISLGTNKYRSDQDTSVVAQKKSTGTPYYLVDTPGHGKLRPTVSLTTSTISDAQLYGVIFVVDASALDNSTYLTDAAGYLHDVLVSLLRRRKDKKHVKKKADRERHIPILIAANKQDLFTALPAGSVKERLEKEIQRIRESRTRGVVGVDAGEGDIDEDDEDIFATGEKGFTFAELEDEDGANMRIEALGGSVTGEEAGKGVRRWEEWVGTCL